MDAFFTLERSLYLGLVGVALIAAPAVLIAAQRQTRRAVRADIGSLSRMFRDVRKNALRESYPMELGEFAGVFDYLRESGRKLVEEKRKLKGLGLIDHLSQLSNRRYFEKRLKELFEATRTHGPSSVLIIDVDHFKQVNDQHGHDIGDALIVAFAKALREAVRQTDFLARLGGDEFCVIYPYAPLAKANAFVERLRKQLPRELQLPKGIVHPLKWTGGVSAIQDGDKKFDEVLWRADKALLEAKTAGRNNTKVYQPEAAKPRLRLMM
jgi:diguanylate cyclase (GGDEF)-like protein